MTGHIKVGGSWREVKGAHIKVNGTWREADAVYKKINGTWREVFRRDFLFSILSNQTNANLRSLAVSAGWNQQSHAVATIAAGVDISSNNTNTAALTINGSWPGGVTLINKGTVHGMGGAGGRGGADASTGSANGSNGAAGGTGLAVTVGGVTVDNQGTISGGGGGGGGGGGIWNDSRGDKAGFAGGGGGGGQSSRTTNSSGGGAGGDLHNPTRPAGKGDSGTHAGPGNGGDYAYGPRSALGDTGSYSYLNLLTGAGGKGGASGQAGSSGQSGSGANATTPPSWKFGTPGSGGAAGKSVTGNSNITWINTGTRKGPIT